MDAESVRAMLLRNLELAADDPVASHDMYHDDAVLEFPQSGERFEGVASIREWRSRYGGSVSFDIRRIRGADDIWVAASESVVRTAYARALPSTVSGRRLETERVERNACAETLLSRRSPDRRHR
jgi:hypothetical protein